ncbi:MAG TPA: ATP-binding protein [Actinomycetota bacterium]|nr:ATP-binding protein [Actinomycetota bacterium]
MPKKSKVAEERIPKDSSADLASDALGAIERRRWELLGLVAFIMVALAGGMALLTAESSPFQVGSVLPMYVIRVLFIGFACIVGLYLFDKETRLRNLTRMLVEQRMQAASLSNRLKDLSILSEVGRVMNEVLQLEELLRIILRSALDILEADRGAILLVDEDGNNLVVEASDNKEAVGMKLAFGQGIAGRVAQHRTPVVVDSPPSPSLYQGILGIEQETHSGVWVPLESEGQLFGVLMVAESKKGRTFGDVDLHALTLFAGHAAVAIRNGLAYERERDNAQKLTETDRLRSEFMAMIAHDLKNPLSAMIGCAETVRKRHDALTDRQRDDALSVIGREGGRLLRMIDEVLSASRMESGGFKIKPQVVDLAEVALSAISTFRGAGVSNPISLDSPRSVQLLGDATSLEQILNNLLENAVKYSPPDGAIDVRIKDQEDMVVLEVQDNGRGIPAEDLPSIFERYRQLESPFRRAGGVGLGLYIVKNLVEAHDGRISVDSEEGRGSKFSVSLPKRKEEDG